MVASRLNVTQDRASALLVSLAYSLLLAGDRALPKATAATVMALSKAVRASLEADEKEIALNLLEEITTTLKGEEGIYAEAVARKVEQVTRSVTWVPKTT